MHGKCKTRGDSTSRLCQLAGNRAAELTFGQAFIKACGERSVVISRRDILK